MQHGLAFLSLVSYIRKIKLQAEEVYNDFSETLEALLGNCHCCLLHLGPRVI